MCHTSCVDEAITGHQRRPMLCLTLWLKLYELSLCWSCTCAALWVAMLGKQRDTV